MGIGSNNPLTFIQHITPFFTFCKPGFIFSLYQISIIVMPVQHSTNRGISPLMQSFTFLPVHMMIMIIIRNPVYTVLKQSIYNLLNLLTGSIFRKYPLHNLCRFRFFDQLIDYIYLLTAITIRGCCSNILPIFLCYSLCCPLLCGNVLCIGIIYQILDIHG